MRYGTDFPIKLLVLLGLAALSACKKDPPQVPPPAAASYTVGGMLSGLTGSVKG